MYYFLLDELKILVGSQGVGFQVNLAANSRAKLVIERDLCFLGLLEKYLCFIPFFFWSYFCCCFSYFSNILLVYSWKLTIASWSYKAETLSLCFSTYESSGPIKRCPPSIHLFILLPVENTSPADHADVLPHWTHLWLWHLTYNAPLTLVLVVFSAVFKNYLYSSATWEPLLILIHWLVMIIVPPFFSGPLSSSSVFAALPFSWYASCCIERLYFNSASFFGLNCFLMGFKMICPLLELKVYVFVLPLLFTFLSCSQGRPRRNACNIY